MRTLFIIGGFMPVGSIVDIALGLIILLAFLIGMVKGFAKQFSNFVCTIAAIIVASLLSTIIVEKLMAIEVIASFGQYPAAWFSDPALSVEISLSLDAAAGAQAVADSLPAGAFKVLAFFKDAIYAGMVAVGTSTVAGYLGVSIIKLALDLVIWTLLYIGVFYGLKGIRFLLKKINQLGFFKLIDKLVGIVWALAWTYLIIVSVGLTATEIVLVKFLPGAQEGFYAILEASKLLSLAHNTNFLGALIAQAFNLTLPQLPFIVPAEPPPIETVAEIFRLLTSF